MDNQNIEIIHFLPYILQDFWEMGTPSKIVINLIQKQFRNFSNLNVLDLGCGKGAVSVKLASALKCNCYGIDYIPEFITISKRKANEYGVETLCRFEVGDICEKINKLDRFDIIILGSIGSALGDYYTTLTMLSDHLKTNGIIIIYDAYIDDVSKYQQLKKTAYSWVLSRQEILKQIKQAKMELIEEIVCKYSEITDNVKEIENIKIRCNELKTQYPEKSALFEKYMQQQIDGYDMLEKDLINSIMILQIQQMK